MSWLTSANGVIGSIFRQREPAGIPPKPELDLMIVRRGLSPAFYFFCRVFAKEHGMLVVPDRRANERREGATQWRKEDFIVVPNSQRTSGAPERSDAATRADDDTKRES